MTHVHTADRAVTPARQLKLSRERRCQATSGAAEQRSSFVRHSTLLISSVAFSFWALLWWENGLLSSPILCSENKLHAVQLFSFILCFLLSRTCTAFPVPGNQPSKQYSLLCETRCLINPGAWMCYLWFSFWLCYLIASVILEVTECLCISVLHWYVGLSHYGIQRIFFFFFGFLLNTEKASLHCCSI